MSIRILQAAIAKSWAVGLMVVLSTATAAEVDEATVTLLGTCVACHGADGIGKAPQYPNLRGQKAAYLEKQLLAFRSGERDDPNMYPLAKGLSDENIRVLAAWFANLDPACSEQGAAP